MDADPADFDSDALADCLNQLARGDLAARDRIIELCSGRLRVLASRMLARFPNVRRWDDTDDVFQNAAMRLHRALAQVQPDSPRAMMSLAAAQLHWELVDLARRHTGPMSFAANHVTRQPGRGPRASDSDSGPAGGVDAAAEHDEPLDRWTLFHEAIAALPAELREVFHFVWYLGADQKTTARVLGCSERTVKNRWREARESVRAALDGETPR